MLKELKLVKRKKMTVNWSDIIDVPNNLIFRNPGADGSMILNDLCESMLMLWLSPDYRNQETVNRISTNNGEWVADRNGYVNCMLVTQANAAGAWTQIMIIINGKQVDLRHDENKIINGFTQLRSVLSVRKSDVVKFEIMNVGTTGSTVRIQSLLCNFIPVKVTAVFE
jgi:hypothetical protein